MGRRSQVEQGRVEPGSAQRGEAEPSMPQSGQQEGFPDQEGHQALEQVDCRWEQEDVCRAWVAQRAWAGVPVLLKAERKAEALAVLSVQKWGALVGWRVRLGLAASPPREAS